MHNIHRNITVLSAAALMSLAPGGAALADTPAIHTMAEIVIKLKETPQESEKQQLRQIMKHGSEAERAIAEALLYLNHHAQPEHKARLRTISKDKNLAIMMKTRALAGIVERFDHKASTVDRMMLNGM